jgi:hypothetical protein
MLLNVSTSIWFGVVLTEDLYYADDTLWAAAGNFDPRETQRNVPIDGVNGGDRIVELPAVPSEAEITAYLSTVLGVLDDPRAVQVRRVYVGQDVDGNFTDVLRDISVWR